MDTGSSSIWHTYQHGHRNLITYNVFIRKPELRFLLEFSEWAIVLTSHPHTVLDARYLWACFSLCVWHHSVGIDGVYVYVLTLKWQLWCKFVFEVARDKGGLWIRKKKRACRGPRTCKTDRFAGCRKLKVVIKQRDHIRQWWSVTRGSVGGGVGCKVCSKKCRVSRAVLYERALTRVLNSQFVNEKPVFPEFVLLLLEQALALY